MELYRGYDGRGLNHLETLYQQGERDLAMDFVRLLGCTPIPTMQVNETGSTYICVHPDDNDRDPINNVLYLSEIRPAQAKLEAQLRISLGKDAELAKAHGAYRHKAETLPYGIPHFGLRFPSFNRSRAKRTGTMFEPNHAGALSGAHSPSWRQRGAVAGHYPGLCLYRHHRVRSVLPGAGYRITGAARQLRAVSRPVPARPHESH